MAEDVAALLGRLAIKQAGVFGFSLGGATALRLAIRHPDLVRKPVIVSASYNNEGFYPSIIAGWPYMSAQALVGTPMEQAYAQTAPNPKHWPVFVEKVKHALTCQAIYECYFAASSSSPLDTTPKIEYICSSK
jgi:pimeloyl-ACP methyl ester carboxylesterase